MNWLWAIIVGLVLGVLARAIIPGRQAIPIWLTIIFGLLGAVLGNAVSSWAGVETTEGFDWIRHGLQLGGAVLLVAIGAPLWASIRGKNRARGQQARM
jgi:uncharacterized membrane protein YeaQ/YmgE (transglycosylase-associated protein family)